MPSLGDLASRVRVRPLAEPEAYLVGALHLQSLRQVGITPERQQHGQPVGHVQSVADTWALRHADLPAWVAEYDGQHVGLAIARTPALPYSDGAPRLIHLSPLPAQQEDAPEHLGDAVCLRLVTTVVAWARALGADEVEVARGVCIPGPVLDAARADAQEGSRVSLPTHA